MHLTQIGALRAMVRMTTSGVEATAGRSARNARGRARDMPDDTGWTDIRLKSLDAKLEDRGMVKRGIALYKRHNTVLDAEGGSIKSQQDKGFEQTLQSLEAMCRKNHMALNTKDAEQTCHALARFIANDKDTLRISVAPKDPVAIGQILAAYFPFFSDDSLLSLRELNIEVKS